MKGPSPAGIVSRVVLALASVPALRLAAPAQEAASSSDQIVQISPYVINEKGLVDWNSQMTFSGSRFAQNLLDIPINISIITEDFMKDVGASNLLELLP